MVEVKDLSYRVQERILMQAATLTFEPQLFHVIMGANGAGKSTLLKVASGLLQPTTGIVLLQGKEIRLYTKRELAIKRAVLSQHYHIAFPITVSEVILMGRYPFYSNMLSAKDRRICQEVIQLMHLEELSGRYYHTLSGGEAQKVQMCRVLAQIWEAKDGEDKVLFLDEPVSNLDVKYQYQLMQIARELCRHPITVIAILHDLNLALTFADRILFMKEGEMVYDLRNPKEISSQVIHDVFDIQATVEVVHQKTVVLF